MNSDFEIVYIDDKIIFKKRLLSKRVAKEENALDIKHVYHIYRILTIL